MRIGVNALYLIPGGVGGTEIYLRRLLQAMAALDPPHQFVLYTNRETGIDLGPEHFVKRVQPVRARNRPWRIAWEQTGLLRALRRDQVDVLLNPGFTAPLLAPCPQVTVFHDLQHLRHPEHFRWFDLPFWRMLLQGSARRSDRLIAVSEATRADLEKHYGVRPVDVIHHGVEPEFFTLRRGRPRRFLLCVSTLHPHKNLELLVSAFSEFRREHTEFRLVIAGMRGFHAEALERRIAAENAAEFVTLTGWIPREELYGLFRDAWAFLYPSTFEGFGMPVLEAMAAGLPAACSAIPPLREVAAGAALYFDPADRAGLLDAMRRIVTDEMLRERLAAAGRDRAREFTWERTAGAVLNSLERAYRSKSSS
ncbi:MAG: glycosyltransferase family 4 protein [Bryobacteraceae bacterium]|nr:glycosyltransferase family 4 protein [Bryobacteraceae bacterium]